ncbi:hypothetical protein DV735_g3330, partial [Chaetothyriales sp. CBS 134920]
MRSTTHTDGDLTASSDMAIDLATASNNPSVDRTPRGGRASPGLPPGPYTERAAMFAGPTGHQSSGSADHLATLKPAVPGPPSTRPLSHRGPYGPGSHGQLNGVPKPNLTSRRRQSSIPKMPMGPRPLDNMAPASMGKRSVSNSLLQDLSSGTSSLRGTPTATVHDPRAFHPSVNDMSRFTFASAVPAAPHHSPLGQPDIDLGTFLEPTFNFDEFHDRITVTNPDLSSFPLPGGTSFHASSRQRSPIRKAQQQEPSTAQAASAFPSLRTGGPPGNSATAVSNPQTTLIPPAPSPTKAESMPAPALTPTQPILRGRRQSHFPPNAFNNGGATASTKAPRKSIGPGTFVAPEQDKLDSLNRRPSVGGRKSSSENRSGLSLRLMNRKKEATGINGSEEKQSPKTIKARTVPAQKSQVSNDPLAPARTPDPAHGLAVSQGSATPKRTSTPGTVNRRMSAMPSHVSGLGARTISPTDARRLKRMSMVPPAPPLPQTRISQAPPSPQPEPVPALSQATPVHSVNTKSMTPSSSRTTPDHNRKSYSSGQSLSSATSLNSVRTPGLGSGRASQALNSSRLPTPKPKLDLSSSPQSHPDGEVPPVPAIPKAYESPGSETDQPYFSARSSSLPPIDTPLSASPLVTTFGDAMAALETSQGATPPPPGGSIAETEAPPKQKSQPRPIKKNDKASLRLPPLNLLPLSTPTSARIKAFLDTRTEAQDGVETPLGGRTGTKTPSTPMTASKAGFAIRNNRPGDDGFLRSSTSHFVIRPDSLQGRTSPSLPAFAFDNEVPTPDRTISPFVSMSLPKNGDFTNFMRPHFHADLNRSPGPKPNGPRAPSFSAKSVVTESPVEKASDSESAFSVPALRRKLSRKKNDTKRSEAKAADPPPPADASKYNSMPPPKLPASTTWSDKLPSASGSAAPQKPPPTYVRSRRQTSGSSTKAGPKRQESSDSNVTHLSGRPSIDSTRSLGLQSNRSESVLPSASPMAKVKASEPPLDKDDLAAEEEMKKLAAKRRGAESEARQLDVLRARACAAEHMSAATALHVHNLNIFERGEIIDFPDVYFVGTKTARKIVGDNNLAATNFGYDDERGDYNIVEGDHLAYRYEVVDVLGKGSFGQVVRCIDHKTGELVAVKIIRNKKRFHQQALVEVNILKKLKQWDPDKVHSVINFDQSFYFRGHLCISTDLLGMNLYEFIKAHDFRGFSLKLIRRFTKQILNSLMLLQRHNVIHCDLKPENILLAHPVHSEIKVIDFGSSCFETEKVYTYIQSRFYRSPEVILGMSYGMPIDMWSVGCILAELYTGYPIFPGENEQEQLACIMEVFGPPEKRLIEKSSRKKLFFDSMGKPRLTVSSKGRRRRPSSKELRQVLKCEDEAFLDFITRCLRWDPARRMTPIEASRHEFITGVKMSQPQRARGVQSNVNSPVKRLNSVNGSATRPLPVPPSSTLRVNTGRQDASAPGGDAGDKAGHAYGNHVSVGIKSDFVQAGLPNTDNEPLNGSTDNVIVVKSKGEFIAGGTTSLVERLSSGDVIKTPWTGDIREQDCRREIAIEAAVYRRLGEHARLVKMKHWDPEAHTLTLEYMPNGTVEHDMGPHNLLLDDAFDLKIADFSGSSVDGAAALVCPGVRYSMPDREEWKPGRPPTVQEDLFALGSTIYFIATGGEAPFAHLPDEAVEARFLQGVFPDLTGLVGGEIIALCWQGKAHSAEAVREMADLLLQQNGLDKKSTDISLT